MASTSSPAKGPQSLSPHVARPLQAAPAANALSKLVESGSDSDGDDALVRRATGRLLSRLQQKSDEESSDEEEIDGNEAAYERTKRRLLAAKATAAAQDDVEEVDNGQGAYERMKQRLMATTSLQRRLEGEQKQDGQKAVSATAAPSSEDEDEAPIRANRVRKLQTRRAKTASPLASPSPTARSRRSSPGLFVTPDPSPAKKNEASRLSSPTHNADFRERVERIRAQRLAKKQESKQGRTKITEQQEADDSGSNSDSENSRRLTQLTKPTRRAGKKALEAMARDQQRIVRNMQLTHQAKTKKRYNTKDLFAKFGFNQGTEEAEAPGLPTPDTSSVPATSDAEVNLAHETPPTSPPRPEDAPENDVTMTAIETPVPTAPLNDPISKASPRLDKGKGRAPEFQHLPPTQSMAQAPSTTVPKTHIEPQRSTSEMMVELSDSDNGIEVVKPKSRLPVFDNLPARKERESSSLLHLRHLAQLTSPSKKAPKGKKSMTMVQLQGALFQKARQQAHKEREEKVEMLRAKGIIVETEEEREKRQMEIEDMVARFEKEKEEVSKLAKRERAQAKKNGESGDGLVSSDESDDDDYVASGGEDDAEAEGMEGVEDVELDLSGSEDEEADDEDELEEVGDEEHEAEAQASTEDALFDTMADENDENDEEEPRNPNEQWQADEDDDTADVAPHAPTRKGTANRARKVIVDDEDEEEIMAQLIGSPTQGATQDDAMAAFDFCMGAPALGLTQAFAGTMADLKTGSQEHQPLPEEPEQDSIDFLRSLPDSQPIASFSQRNDFFVANSQAGPSQQSYSQNDSVPQLHLGISQLMDESPAPSRTQLSEIPEPTQDAGFLLSRSPAGRAPPQSTVDTVLLAGAESPIAQRKGKLSRRRKEIPVVLSDVDDENVFSASDAEAEAQPAPTANAFSILKKAAKKQKKIDNFNKKTSAAKEHLDEQAYESDDEYKGLGGASDDDSGDDDADLADMIDTNDVKVDERQIAAFYADKSKKDDEARIAKIYKDLQSGAFRKRGAGDAFDMSDSEDEMEMRRRKKQREFDQMFKALKQDETIGKMAENPKRKAFFDTLMDHSDDSDLEFLDNPEEEPTTNSSHSDEEKQDPQDVSIPDSQTADAPTVTAPTNPLKRKSPPLDSQEKENRPPPNLRRTAAADAIIRRPISAADIQNSVAELLEDPRVVVPDSQYLSDSDPEDASTLLIAREDRIVTNRLSRTSTTTETSVSATNMAFHAPSAAATVPGFRVPSLIRRATSNLSAASERSTSTSSKAAEGGVRRGGTGRSNIHAQAREAERRAVLEKAEVKRKEAMRKKVGKARGTRSVLSALGGGFE